MGPGERCTETARTGVNEHCARARVHAVIVGESAIEDSLDAHHLRKVVASSDAAELHTGARCVGDGRAFAIVVAQSRRDLAKRFGQAVHRGEPPRAVGPRDGEQPIPIDSVEERLFERTTHAALERVAPRSFARAYQEQNTAAGIASHQIRPYAVVEQERRPNRDAPPGVQVRHPHRPSARWKRSDASELFDGGRLHPDLGGRDEARMVWKQGDHDQLGGALFRFFPGLALGPSLRMGRATVVHRAMQAFLVAWCMMHRA